MILPPISSGQRLCATMRMRMLCLLALGAVAACSASRSNTGGTSATGDALSNNNGDVWPGPDADHGEGGTDPAPTLTCSTFREACTSVADLDSSKDRYIAQCAALGLELAWVSLQSGPEGTTCSHACCEPPAPGTPSAPATPPRSGPAAPCLPWQTVGDGTTCASISDLSAQATTLCSAANRIVQELDPAKDCDVGATSAQVQCCLADAAPPNPPAN